MHGLGLCRTAGLARSLACRKTDQVQGNSSTVILGNRETVALDDLQLLQFVSSTLSDSLGEEFSSVEDDEPFISSMTNIKTLFFFRRFQVPMPNVYRA